MSLTIPAPERRVTISSPIETFVYATLLNTTLRNRSVRFFEVEFTAKPHVQEGDNYVCYQHKTKSIYWRAYVENWLDFEKMARDTSSLYDEIIGACRENSKYLKLDVKIKLTTVRDISDPAGIDTTIEFGMKGVMDAPGWDLRAQAIASRNYAAALTLHNFSDEETDNSEDTLHLRALDFA